MRASDVEKRDLIAAVCDEILEGKHRDQFWSFGKPVLELK